VGNAEGEGERVEKETETEKEVVRGFMENVRRISLGGGGDERVDIQHRWMRRRGVRCGWWRSRCSSSCETQIHRLASDLHAIANGDVDADIHEHLPPPIKLRSPSPHSSAPAQGGAVRGGGGGAWVVVAVVVGASAVVGDATCLAEGFHFSGEAE
jgi:hypothetical protein